MPRKEQQQDQTRGESVFRLPVTGSDLCKDDMHSSVISSAIYRPL